MLAHKKHTRYKHAKHYEFLKNDEKVGQIIIDVKMSPDTLSKELKECKDMFNADRIILHWTSHDGFVDKEVII